MKKLSPCIIRGNVHAMFESGFADLVEVVVEDLQICILITLVLIDPVLSTESNMFPSDRNVFTIGKSP